MTETRNDHNPRVLRRLDQIHERRGDFPSVLVDQIQHELRGRTKRARGLRMCVRGSGTAEESDTVRRMKVPPISPSTRKMV